MLQPETILNGRYRILEPVGEGGMAAVYRALDTRLGRTVAVKVLLPQFARDESFLQRFHHEAEFAASLGAHPNIVAIYDIGQDGPLHYIVMELIEGRSLKDLIRQRAPFSVAEAFSIGQQVASALDFAHKRGLVHRDVKPQNIMVTPEGVAKVTDFGIARSLSASQLTRTGVVIGTVHYFSPEQAQGKPAGPASDIYSLGVILYEMLTAHLPFDAENPIGVAMQHVHSEPPPPWDYNPDIPTRSGAVVLRALEKDPERRYRDAAELAGALAGEAASRADTGATTIFSPISASPPRQRTAVYQAVGPEPVEELVAPPSAVAPARPARNPWRTAWLGLAAALLALGVGLAAFWATNNVLGGTSAPPTATVTPSPTARPKKKPTATPKVLVSVPTATLPPPLPTATVPPPTPTPKPKPTRPPPTATLAPPTATLPPADTPTPTLNVPTPTATAVG